MQLPVLPGSHADPGNYMQAFNYLASYVALAFEQHSNVQTVAERYRVTAILGSRDQHQKLPSLATSINFVSVNMEAYTGTNSVPQQSSCNCCHITNF